MGQFKRELTYTGDVSKLTNIQKKRVSSISQEADATTWLGDDVLGVEVIKYDVNGYSVNIKRDDSNNTIFYSFFNPFPCRVECIVNNYDPKNKKVDTNLRLRSSNIVKKKDGSVGIDSGDGWGVSAVDFNGVSYVCSPGFHIFYCVYNKINKDITYRFHPISTSSYIGYNESEESPYDVSDAISYVISRKRFIATLGIEDGVIRLGKLDAIKDYPVYSIGRYGELYTIAFITHETNNKTIKNKIFDVSSAAMLAEALRGDYGRITMILQPLHVSTSLGNLETPTGSPVYSFTKYTRDSPEIAKLTEIYNSIK